MRRYLGALAAVVLLAPFVAAATPAAAQAPFSDVPSTYWAASAIDALAAQGVIRGEPDGLFHPLAPVTRAQFAAMIVRAEHLPKVSVGPNFNDVTPANTLYADIETAAADGLMLGESLTKFAPGATINRAMAATIAVRAIGLGPLGNDLQSQPAGYADSARIPSYALGYVVAAKRLGLMQGMAGNVFDPAGSLDRAQAAAVIYRMLGLPPQSISSLAASVVSQVNGGSSATSIAVGQSTTLWSVARDASGLPVPATVTWSASGGTLNGTTFSAQSPGSYQLMATVQGSSARKAMTIHVEQATSLAIYGLLEVAGPGATVPVQVTVLDQGGKHDVADGSRAITLTATNASSQPVTLTQTAQAGQTTFNFAPPAAGPWSLTASAPGLASGTAAFDVLATPFPSPLQLTGPAQILPGQSAAVTASLPTGASESSPVTLTSSNPAVVSVGGSGTGSLTPSGLSFQVQALAPGSATLTLSNGAGAFESATLAVTVPALGQLALPAPAAVTAGQQATAIVTVMPSLPAPPPSVALTLVNPQGVSVATMTATAQGSAASFNLQEDEAGTWQLKASAPGYTPATTSWVINPGPATQLIATGAPSTIVVAGQSANLQVMLADSYDNPVASPLSVALTTQGNAGTLTGVATALPGPGPAAVFDATTPGTETVDVSDPAAPQFGTQAVTFRVIAQSADVVAGKGFWLLSSDLAKIPAPQLIAQLKSLGATHVYLEVETSYGFYGSDQLRTFLFQAHDAGIAVIAWVYPYLNNVALDESLTQQVADYVAPTGDKPDGIAADIEENLSASAVSSYAAAVRQALGPAGVLIAVTYPPIYHENYPYAALAPYVTLYAPMDYWHYQATSEDFTQAYQYVNQTVGLIRQLSGLPQVPVTVIGQSYDMFSSGAQGVFSPTQLEIEAAFQAASDAGAIGISFYRLPTATASELQTIETLPFPDASN